jgi:hypothetical protein
MHLRLLRTWVLDKLHRANGVKIRTYALVFTVCMLLVLLNICRCKWRSSYKNLHPLHTNGAISSDLENRARYIHVSPFDLQSINCHSKLTSNLGLPYKRRRLLCTGGIFSADPENKAPYLRAFPFLLVFQLWLLRTVKSGYLTCISANFVLVQSLALIYITKIKTYALLD